MKLEIEWEEMMRTRKILDLTDDISLEFKGDFLTFSFPEDLSIKITFNETRELVDWLSKEVLNTSISQSLVADINRDIIPSPTKHAPGPVPLSLEAAKAQVGVPLEDRKAISLNPSSGKLYPLAQAVVEKRDEIQVHNMGSQIHKAKEAFNPESLNKGE